MRMRLNRATVMGFDRIELKGELALELPSLS